MATVHTGMLHQADTALRSLKEVCLLHLASNSSASLKSDHLGRSFPAHKIWGLSLQCDRSSDPLLGFFIPFHGKEG